MVQFAEDRIMEKKCSFCGHAELKEATVTYIYRRNGNYMIVEEVPCEECTYCSERYYEASVLKKIEADFEAIQSKQKNPSRQLEVPVEVFTAI